MPAYIFRRRPTAWLLTLPILVAGLLMAVVPQPAKASAQIVRSVVTGTSGQQYWVTNHLVRFDGRTVASAAAPTPSAAGGTGHEYLLVWTGDANAGDHTGADVKGLAPAVNPVRILNETAVDE